MTVIIFYDSHRLFVKYFTVIYCIIIKTSEVVFMITNEQIRVKLVAAIKNSGITQKELAARVGIVQQSLAQYLSGRAMPALDTFANLCEVLDLDANDILCIREYV